jgi:hypothetical protein
MFFFILAAYWEIPDCRARGLSTFLKFSLGGCRFALKRLSLFGVQAAGRGWSLLSRTGTTSVIKVKVTAQDGSTAQTYTVTVTRAGSQVSTLSNLWSVPERFLLRSAAAELPTPPASWRTRARQ